MLTYISNILKTLGLNEIISNHLSVFATIFGILFISYFIHLIRKIFIVFFPYLKKINHSKAKWIKFAKQHSIFKKLYLLAHLIFILFLVNLTMLEKLPFTTWLTRIIHAAIILCLTGMLASLCSSILNVINDVYRVSFSFAKQRPITSYLDFIKIIIWIIALIIVISNFTNQAPTTMLAGFGAVSAIVILVFKDSILGFISSIQLSAYDIVRIGDWIQIRKHNIDGDVIDISLNTVKIQNFDKTVVTIPTYELMSSGVINWRGMKESGGRRIKRSVNINIDTIKLCDTVLLKKLSKINHLNAYITQKIKNVPEVAKKNTINYDKKLTNVGLYRAYVKAYLSNRSDIQQQNFTFLVRQLQPTEIGLPIEIYVFTKTTNWNEYEDAQADIFDHIISILPVFELKLFQNISSSIEKERFI